MRSIKGVLFDNDGTLVDTHDLILESFQFATRELLGRSVTDEEVARTGGRPLDAQMLVLANGDHKLARELSRVYRDYNHAIHDEKVALFPGVAEGLAALSDAGLALGVVTSKRHWLTQHGLEVTGVAQHFSVLIGADDCDQHKPNPTPLLMGAAALGLEAGECAYIGDSPLDMQASKRAGCTSIAAGWGMFPTAELEAERPDLQCADFDALVSAVLRLYSTDA